MNIEYGNGSTVYGPGVEIKLTGDEIAKAIDLYLYSQGVIVRGARTIYYDGKLFKDLGRVYVDPTGFVIYEGKKFDGRGKPERCGWCGGTGGQMDDCSACKGSGVKPREVTK